MQLTFAALMLLLSAQSPSLRSAHPQSRALTRCVVSFQWLIGTMRVVVFLGMVLLITQLILKSVRNHDIWFRGRHFAVMNVVLASAFCSYSLKQVVCAMLERQVTPS